MPDVSDNARNTAAAPHVLISVVLSVLLIGSARADWVFHDIRYAKPVIGPGESQTIEIWIEFSKWAGVGSSSPPGAFEVLAKYELLIATWFSLLNVSGGETGTFAPIQSWNPKLLNGKPGTVMPNGDVREIGAFAGVPPNPYEFKDNPGWLWSIEWTPEVYTPRTVTFQSEGLSALAQMWIPWTNKHPLKGNWMPISDIASFQVIPGPGTAVALVVGGLLAARRRRG